MSQEIDFEEVYEITIHTAGVDEARDLAKALEKEEAGFRKLVAAMSEHERAAMTTVVATSRLGATTVATGKQIAEVGGSSGKSSQLMMQLGYAADDAQYGMKGLANNIQPILQMIPALGGLAAPISIAAIAAYQLYEHWDQVMALMGAGFPQPTL